MNKQKAKAFLQETIDHYNSNNRSLFDDSCCYIPEDTKQSEGCAIGRKLPKWAKKEVRDKGLNFDTVGYLLDNLSRIPNTFKNLDVYFLSDVQSLHDDEDFWNEQGLSKVGAKEVRRIKLKWGL